MRLKKTIKMERFLEVAFKEYKKHYEIHSALETKIDLMQCIVINEITKKLTNGCRFMKMCQNTYHLVEIESNSYQTLKEFK